MRRAQNFYDLKSQRHVLLAFMFLSSALFGLLQRIPQLSYICLSAGLVSVYLSLHYLRKHKAELQEEKRAADAEYLSARRAYIRRFDDK